jgi:hypothetical protein
MTPTVAAFGGVTPAAADRARLEVLIGQQAPVDGIRQAAFQPPQRFLGRLALEQARNRHVAGADADAQRRQAAGVEVPLARQEGDRAPQVLDLA